MYRRTLVIFFKRYRALFVFFLFLFFAHGFHLVRLIGKKDPVAPQDEKKYIVFFACLMELFAVCPNSTEPGTAEVTEVIGTQIYVTQKCPTCKFVCQWKSQPNIRRIPAGNRLLSAAILYSGSMISQTLRIFKILKVECFSWQTFHKHQNNYLIPVVLK